MSKLNRQQIQALAMQVLEQNPQGIRWMDILRAVQAQSNATPPKSIDGAVHNLLTTRSQEIVKVARGMYQLARYVEADTDDTALIEEAGPLPATPTHTERMLEADFYSSFAEWLVENDEATVADELGGNALGGKWGTPDVIGVLKARAQDIFKFEPQIVAAEIKAVHTQPVVAFGQAVAYRLFSHRSYIVVPRTTSIDDMSRLKSLCGIHGVGLIVFTLNIEQPDYTVIVAAQNATPDVFYVNRMLERLKTNAPALLNKLF